MITAHPFLHSPALIPVGQRDSIVLLTFPGHMCRNQNPSLSLCGNKLS